MNNQLFTIKCLTNMHVGNGDINFSVIDNEVQRDVITNYPCIYSSSLKGALRDYFEDIKSENTIDIFGSDAKTSNSKESGSMQGKVKFMQANILFLPVRASSGDYAYYYVTTKEMLNQYVRYCDLTGNDNREVKNAIEKIDEKTCYRLDNNQDKPGIDFLDNLELEVFENTPKSLLEKTGIEASRVLILSDEKYKFINLPVVARNALNENGISQNLWYEELIPHESIFYFAVLSLGSDDSKNVLKVFSDVFKDKKYVQFGGNASIGNGICEVVKV